MTHPNTHVTLSALAITCVGSNFQTKPTDMLPHSTLSSLDRHYEMYIKTHISSTHHSFNNALGQISIPYSLSFSNMFHHNLMSNFSNLLQSCLRIFTHVVHQHYIIYHSPCQKSFHPQIVPTLRIFTHAVHQHYIIYQHHYLFNLYNFKNKYY